MTPDPPGYPVEHRSSPLRFFARLRARAGEDSTLLVLAPVFPMRVLSFLAGCKILGHRGSRSLEERNP